MRREELPHDRAHDVGCGLPDFPLTKRLSTDGGTRPLKADASLMDILAIGSRLFERLVLERGDLSTFVLA